MRNLNKEEFDISKSKIDMSNLNKLRKQFDFSQVKLQHLVGVSTSSIEAYCQNVRTPSLPVAYRLSEIFDCSIDYIVGKNNELEKYYQLSRKDKEQVVKLINELYKKENE